MISFKHTGDFSKTFAFLEKSNSSSNFSSLDKYGREGVAALQAATPFSTGLTANSWYYEITKSGNTATISFLNSNIQNGVSIAIILQYGHATRNGGWVQGRDYINPAVQPIFDNMAETIWKEVINT